jgi:hypothetical protein
MIPGEILQKIDDNRRRYVEELLAYLQIPSISTYTRNTEDVRRAAEWVFNHLKRLGFQGGICPTNGHPVVFAARCPHADRPTILIYGHYDVQPPEPLDEWVTKPFEPSIRDDCIYARGPRTKGQLMTYKGHGSHFGGDRRAPHQCQGDGGRGGDRQPQSEELYSKPAG